MAPALLHASLAADRYLIDGYLERLLEDELALGKGAVPQAMRYGVLGPAQRIRPIISIRLARVFDTPLEAVIPLGAAVELLHCASLIVDDLPCMDDSPFRRNKPAVHIQFGEATSVLAAFGLVALAARTVVDRGSARDSAERLLGFQIQLLRSMDCSGLIGGQALDLQFTGHVSLPGPFDISELKTVPLFRLAVSAGAFFADLDSNEEALLNCFGHEFGLAFQITDDLLDGESRQRAILDEKLSTLRAVIAPFGHRRSHLEELIDFLDGRVSGGPQE
ncbi:MAG TPA: polyprenyl synthetase family protein [Bryobacteraceae bacterium]|jgi:geranylgeranyl pyrophosphate synthase|nr:polyprenyl synthetase family protein [Bryobacteraceae bacterium]